MRIRLNRQIKGFTMVEVLMVILAISVTLAATVSVITKRKHASTGTEENAMNCILRNAVDFNYNSSTGNITSYPDSGSCYAAYFGCQQGRPDVCNTLFSYADGAGNANQTLSALKIVRASCDNGGTQACDYLFSRCTGNQTGCSSPNSKFTINYYLNMLSTSTDSNDGRLYTERQGKVYYNWTVSTFKNEIDSNVCKTCVTNKTACIIKGCP